MSHDWRARPIGSIKGVGAEMERKLARLAASRGDRQLHLHDLEAEREGRRQGTRAGV